MDPRPEEHDIRCMQETVMEGSEYFYKYKDLDEVNSLLGKEKSRNYKIQVNKKTQVRK